MAAGKPAGFTVDGPRGPARVAQPGAVWLAKATGNPVLPFHLEAERHWTLEQLGPHADSQAVLDGAHRRSASRSTCAPDADDAAIEAARRLLDERLKALERARSDAGIVATASRRVSRSST